MIKGGNSFIFFLSDFITRMGQAFGDGMRSKMNSASGTHVIKNIKQIHETRRAMWILLYMCGSYQTSVTQMSQITNNAYSSAK